MTKDKIVSFALTAQQRSRIEILMKQRRSCLGIAPRSVSEYIRSLIWQDWLRYTEKEGDPNKS